MIGIYAHGVSTGIYQASSKVRNRTSMRAWRRLVCFMNNGLGVLSHIHTCVGPTLRFPCSHPSYSPTSMGPTLLLDERHCCSIKMRMNAGLSFTHTGSVITAPRVGATCCLLRSSHCFCPAHARNSSNRINLDISSVR